MSNSELLKEAAAAVRKLVEDNDKLQKDSEVYSECLKVAFDLASRGQIESDYDDIVGKAKELFDNQDELPVIKKAMELNVNYQSVGDLEKTSSKTGVSRAEEIFESILLRG